MRLSFQNGFYAGLIFAAILGVYLFQLWQPEKQVRLHSRHLLDALERKDWAKLADFVDESYQDQWGENRALLLMRLREVLRYTRNLHFDAQVVLMNVHGREGKWDARVTVDADANELTALIKERVNTLASPFRLRWQRKSGKPWDWKLVAASNESLELPSGEF